MRDVEQAGVDKTVNKQGIYVHVSMSAPWTMTILGGILVVIVTLVLCGVWAGVNIRG